MKHFLFGFGARKTSVLLFVFFASLLGALACSRSTPQNGGVPTSTSEFPESQETTAPITTPTQYAPPTGGGSIPTRPASNVPTLLWKSERPYANYLIVGERMIVSHENNVTAYDVLTGMILWELNTTGYAIASDQNYVYILPGNQRVDAVRTDTGETVWRALFDTPIIKPVSTSQS